MTVVPAAAGWWVATRCGENFTREPVAAWLMEDDGAITALIPNGNAGLATAEATAFLFSDAKPERCSCGRRVGEADDPAWCPDCGGVIE